MLVPGTVLVFVATWLYMEAAPLNKGKAKLDRGTPPLKASKLRSLRKVCTILTQSTTSS